MALIWELKTSGSGVSGGQSPSAKLNYIVYGTFLDSDVETLAGATAPLTYRGLNRKEISWEPEGGGVWMVTVDYGINAEEKSQEPTQGEYTQSFDTSAGSTKVTQSIATKGKYSASTDEAPDYKGAIGVNGETVEGTEVYTPKFEYTEVHFVPVEQVTGMYIQSLYRLTAKVNNASWRGFPSGELLFLGASGTGKWSDGWQITFKFLGSPNAIDLTVGDIQHVNKLGHEYLWIKYADVIDETTNVVVKRPRYCYVEQVYHLDDFEQLGIGG